MIKLFCDKCGKEVKSKFFKSSAYVKTIETEKQAELIQLCTKHFSEFKVWCKQN